MIDAVFNPKASQPDHEAQASLATDELRSDGGRQRVVLLLLNAFLILPVILYTLNSLSIRYYGDDYCVGVEVQNYGAVGAAVYFYNTWVGRLTALLAHGALLELGGWPVGAAATLAMCVLWWALLFAVARQFARWRGLPPLIAAALASLVFLGTFGFIEIMQAVYWLPGSTMYFLPLVLGAGYAWLAVRGSAGWLSLIVGAALAFTAALCSDVYALTQMELIGLGLLFWWCSPNRRRVLLIGMIVSVVALVILLIAPGNDARIAASRPEPPDIGAVALQTLFSPAIMMWRTLELNGFPLQAVIIAALIAPMTLAFAFDRAPTRWLAPLLVAIPLLMCAVIMSFWFPTVYLSSTWAPRRAWVAPQVAVVLLWMAWGYGWGLVLRRAVQSLDAERYVWRLRASAFALLILATLILFAGSLMRAANTGGELRALAGWWSESDALLSASAGQPVEVALARPPGTLGTLRVLSPGAAAWPNHCISRYFGVASVIMSDG